MSHSQHIAITGVGAVCGAGLSVDEMHCLTQLYLDHPCCVKRLTESLYVTATRTSKILRKLERRGMIARAIDQNDRRKERISLTDIGRSHAERILFLSAQAAEKLSVTKLD